MSALHDGNDVMKKIARAIGGAICLGTLVVSAQAGTGSDRIVSGGQYRGSPIFGFPVGSLPAGPIHPAFRLQRANEHWRFR